MNKYNWFTAEFSLLTEVEQISLYNDFCEYKNRYSSKIYPIAMFNELFKYSTPLEMVEMCNKQKINCKDRYFTIGGLGLQTLNDPSTYIRYHYFDIFNCEEVWKKYIAEEHYISYLFEKLYGLKPNDMDDLIFFEIISNAADYSIYYDDIREEVSEKVKA